MTMDASTSRKDLTLQKLPNYIIQFLPSYNIFTKAI